MARRKITSKASKTGVSKLTRGRLAFLSKLSLRQYVIIAAVLIMLGIIALAVSAAGPTWEVENWSKSNSSVVNVSDNTASNGQAIKFGVATSGGEDVRNVKGEMGLIPTDPASLISQWLVPWSLPSAGGEGAFRFQCKPGQLLYDDPIVSPGKPGAAHLHLFYGNDTTNANSTYESLRKNGTGTCEGGPTNRSAYWIPALLNGSNKVILPDFVQVYYKVQLPMISSLGYVPRGLRSIAGNPMDSGATEAQVYGPANSSVPGGYYKSPIWKCYANDGFGAQRNESDRIPQCQDGDRMYASVPFPYCWDKDKRIDSNDHRTHVVFPPDYDDKCPPSHPYRIPEFTIITSWSIRSGDAAQMKNWFLSSDRHEGHPVYPNGKSMHADWFGAWDDAVMKRWVDNCLKGGKSCNNANLGDGVAGKRPIEPWYEQHPNRLVDIPPKP